MWRAEEGAGLPDLPRVVEALGAADGFFARGAPVVVARAPARLDVMGGIADYSGALVLELPLAAATLVAAQASDDGRVTVRSAAAAELGAAAEASVPVDALTVAGAPLDYDAARALLARDPRTRWAAYVVGALVALVRERGLAFPRGVRLLVESTVPLGKGVSSSAALEVATARALCALGGVALDGRALALLCQRVENLVVGAPCGVMDQMTAACGEDGRLLALLCQPAELRAPVAVPAGVRFWGIDSGIRHEVGGADYGAVRVGAFMGYRVVAALAGLAATRADDDTVRVDDPRWGGHLANVSPAEWAAAFRDRVPETMHGADFLARYGGTTDAVTRVDPERTYAVRGPAEHPILEHHRVRLFRALLDAPGGAVPDDERLALLGELMYQSHASYGALGLGSGGTDRLVSLVRAAGAAAGLYGAKITGGGSGGVVAVLARADAADAVRAVARAYEQETGRAAAVLGGSSAGAVTAGVARLRWRA